MELPKTQEELLEIDRNARAYGYEIGQGQDLNKKKINASPGNPFLDPKWRDPYEDREED